MCYGQTDKENYQATSYFELFLFNSPWNKCFYQVIIVSISTMFAILILITRGPLIDMMQLRLWQGSEIIQIVLYGMHLFTLYSL